MDKQRKQSWEERTYNFDFSNKLVSGRTLASCLPLIQSVFFKPKSVPGTPVALTISGITLSSPIVQSRIGAGEHGVIYKITARGTDSAGDKVEMDGLLEIKDV